MTGIAGRPVATDRFPQEGAGTEACPQVRGTLGRLRSTSASFRRDRTKQTRLPHPGMAAGPGMGTHHSRGIRCGAEPYAGRGTSGVATGPAQNRRFLAPDGRSAPGLVAACHHRTPGLRCHAQRRSPSPAAWAAGMPPHPAVPDEPRQPARTATGGEPLPKPVSCNKEKAEIWVVRDRLRKGRFRRSSRGAHAWRASRVAPESAGPSP